MAASNFARAAALYAQGMSQTGPALADSCLSSSASDASSLTDEASAFSFFSPLHEETEMLGENADVTPVPDQSWWEEFGEWESAAQVSPSIEPQHVTYATQPRLVVGDQIVRLPIARGSAQLSYDSFPELRKLTQALISSDGAMSHSPGAVVALPKRGLNKVLVVILTSSSGFVFSAVIKHGVSSAGTTCCMAL